jgi:hypothetical protein
LRDERGEKGGGLTSPTTRQLKVLREMREEKGGWIVNNKRIIIFERDERGEKGSGLPLLARKFRTSSFEKGERKKGAPIAITSSKQV